VQHGNAISIAQPVYLVIALTLSIRPGNNVLAAFMLANCSARPSAE